MVADADVLQKGRVKSVRIINRKMFETTSTGTRLTWNRSLCHWPLLPVYRMTFVVGLPRFWQQQ